VAFGGTKIIMAGTNKDNRDEGKRFGIPICDYLVGGGLN